MKLDTVFESKLYAKETIELPNIIKNKLPKIQFVYQPENSQELEKMISQMTRNRLTIIPRGAATSGMGGITPLKKSILMDLTHLNGIIEFDRKNKTIYFESGIRWWDLKRFLNKHSFDLFTYPTSLFSTVGGWLATGGYGINSYQFGHISDFTKSIDIVTSNTSKRIGRNDPEFKYFIGTEGQMGIINRVKLKVRELNPSQPYLVFFNTTEEAVSFLCDLTTESSKIRPLHISYFDRFRLEHKNSLPHGNLSFPQKEGVLVSFDNSLSDAAFLNLVRRKKGTLAEDFLTALVWNERFFPFSIRRFYPSMLGCEVMLPVKNISPYIKYTRIFGKDYGIRLSTEITLINKNKAIAFTIFPSDPENFSHYFHLLLSYTLAQIASKCGGKPYGIGIWNLPLLEKTLSKEAIREYKHFKKESDPLNIFNPAKAFSSGLTVKPILKLAYTISGAFSNGNPLLKSLSKILNNHHEINSRNLPEQEACANCGACTVVCPSYLINKTEAVTAKGKLFLMKNYLNGSTLPTHLREKIFQCLHCHLCEYVCQSKLKLNPVWDRLESILERKFIRPKEKIEEFIKKVESHPDYSELLDSYNISPNNNHKDAPNV